MSARQLGGATAIGGTAITPDRPTRAAPGRRDATPAVVLPRLTGAPAREIATRARRSVTVFAMDRSGSMYHGVRGGDPSDICGAAAESIVELQRRSGGGRALVVPWGTDTPASLVVGPLDVRRGRRDLSRSLREHSSLGGNNLPLALRRVAERLPRLAADETVTTFVLTDGGEEVTAEMHAAVAGLPAGSVHLALIDPAGLCTPEMEERWKTVAFGSFTRFEHLDVRSIADEMATAYAGTLGLGS